MNEPPTDTAGTGGAVTRGAHTPADQPCNDLTAVIICCNNERTMDATLTSIVHLVGQIIVVDSGSTDGTLQIAMRYGCRIVPHEWEGHVRQKQFALELCDTPWALSIDSDESIDDELANSIREAIRANDPAVDGYEMNRRTCVGGHWLNHAWQPEWRVRLVRSRGAARWSGYDPHDSLKVNSGRTRRLQGTLRHDSYENVADLLRKQIGHGIRTAESYHRMGRRGSVPMLILSPLGAVLKQLVFKQAFLDGWRGWVAAFATGVGTAAKQLQLMELTHDEQRAARLGPPPTVPE